MYKKIVSIGRVYHEAGSGDSGVSVAEARYSFA